MNEKFSEDYLDGYEAGLAFMLKGEREHQRLAAFGAIRRAAGFARYYEQRAADWKRNGVWDLADNAAFSADAIRRAIRAAIRSPKE